MTTITYRNDYRPTVREFRCVLKSSTLGERRPVTNEMILAKMLLHANLIITAWDNDNIVGISRSVTDFAYCCYLSDLAVDGEFQKQGIGRALIEHTRSQLEATCTLILLSAPRAVAFYESIGMKKHSAAFVSGQA